MKIIEFSKFSSKGLYILYNNKGCCLAKYFEAKFPLNFLKCNKKACNFGF